MGNLRQLKQTKNEEINKLLMNYEFKIRQPEKFEQKLDQKLQELAVIEEKIERDKK